MIFQLLTIQISIKYIFFLILVHGLTCYCEHQCPDGQTNGTCVTSRYSQCFSAVHEEVNEETGEYEPIVSYGCLAAGEQGFLQVNIFKILMCILIYNILS